MRGATINASGGTVKSAVKNPLNVVLIGQKIVSKDMDDGFVYNCGNACAKKLSVTPIKVSTGLEFINALERATISKELSACVFWGHSWAIGLYLQDNQGLYIDDLYNKYQSVLPAGARKLSHIKNSSIKTTPHSLFIFASCGTATDPDRKSKGYFDTSFAAKFAQYINKTDASSLKEGNSTFKVTVIGATNLSNLLTDGTVRTDGFFMKIETTIRVQKRRIEKEVEEGIWPFNTKKKVFDRCDISTTTSTSAPTSLGKKIDPAEIIKKHDPNG